MIDLVVPTDAGDCTIQLGCLAAKESLGLQFQNHGVGLKIT